MSVPDDRATLLTCDGLGKAAKERTLERLLASIVPAQKADHWEAHAHQLAATLRAIVDGAVHPETAVRRVMVDLAPIRAALARYEAAKKRGALVAGGR